MATITKRLRMHFTDEDGKNVMISVGNPNEDINGGDIKAVMDTIAKQKAMVSATGKTLEQVVKAEYVGTTVEPVDFDEE